MINLFQEEIKANRGKVVDDPFTRRSTRPKMFSQKEETVIPIVKEREIPIEIEDKPIIKEKAPAPRVDKMDLFDAHNFDINIDFNVPLTSNSLSIMPKPVANVKDSRPRQILNLEDYKKKRGLI